MLHITLICVGRLKEDYFTAAVAEYAKRLGAFCTLNIEEVPETRLPSNPSTAELDAALSKEADTIELRIPKNSVTVALSPEGRETDSVQFSKFIRACEKDGKNRLCFIIGGSVGLHKRIKSNARVMLSMSKMTFPHHLFRVMFLEQLYRAFKIAGGGKYHK
jgi:23S rRNA (pseudouridine1915-N3)-methyltransferase